MANILSQYHPLLILKQYNQVSTLMLSSHLLTSLSGAPFKDEFRQGFLCIPDKTLLASYPVAYYISHYYYFNRNFGPFHILSRMSDNYL
jgi:hypothetical protein